MLLRKTSFMQKARSWMRALNFFVFLLDLDEPDTGAQLEGAIKCGTDYEGNDTYVARVSFQNDLLPASYVPEKRAVRASWGWKAYMRNFGAELLVDCEHKWVPAENGEVPAGAIQTGYSYTGETLLVQNI